GPRRGPLRPLSGEVGARTTAPPPAPGPGRPAGVPASVEHGARGDCATAEARVRTSRKVSARARTDNGEVGMGHPSSPVPPVPEPLPDPAPPSALSRRGLFAHGGRAAAAGGAVWLMSPAQRAAAAAAPAEGGAPEATVTQGTNISAAPSPDGRWIAFDLYTSIWLVPAEGGEARRLTGDLADATRPRFSPDSGQVAFQAYAEGNYHVYVIDLPDGKPRRLTSGP